MAHFRATIKGSRGLASRLGTKQSGMRATVNGWNVGVTIIAKHLHGKDFICVYRTGGSNNDDGERIAVLED